MGEGRPYYLGSKDSKEVDDWTKKRFRSMTTSFGGGVLYWIPNSSRREVYASDSHSMQPPLVILQHLEAGCRQPMSLNPSSKLDNMQFSRSVVIKFIALVR